MDHVEYTYTTGMSDEEVDRRLHEEHHGVLALARDGDAYAVPMSFHYDGETLLLRLSREGDSDKLEYLATTGTATLVLYGAEGETHSWSVLVRGPVRELPDSRREAISDADINAWFPPFRLFDEDISNLEYELHELVPESVTGRKTMD